MLDSPPCLLAYVIRDVHLTRARVGDPIPIARPLACCVFAPHRPATPRVGRFDCMRWNRQGLFRQGAGPDEPASCACARTSACGHPRPPSPSPCPASSALLLSNASRVPPFSRWMPWRRAGICERGLSAPHTEHVSRLLHRLAHRDLAQLPRHSVDSRVVHRHVLSPAIPPPRCALRPAALPASSRSHCECGWPPRAPARACCSAWALFCVPSRCCSWGCCSCLHA